MPKKKKQKISSSDTGTSEDGPLFRALCAKGASGKQSAILDSHPNVLADLLSPALTPDDFLTHHFRRQAVYVPSRQGRDRIQKVCEQMLNLNVEQLFENTASENIFVWLVQQQQQQQPEESSKQQDVNKKINSIEVPDSRTAYALYQAGHATYCRAPPAVEEVLLPALLENTGLGCGQYDASGQSMTSMGRAEVETFISTQTGSITGWHTDFQENFTIQLSGRKKWSLQRGTVTNVLRGVTPHYAVSAIEGQIKAGRLDQNDFGFGPPTIGENATGPVDEVVLEPGDVLYFPAGMWHKIEVLEPGISINCSLMATNYATLVCQSLQHLLLQRTEWRASVCRPPDGSSTITDKLQSLLEDLPRIIDNWNQQGGAAQGIIPPVLQHGEVNPPDDESWEEMDTEINKNAERGNDDTDDDVENAATEMNDHDDDEHSSELSTGDADTDDDPIVDLSDPPPENAEFDPSPSALQNKFKTHKLSRNPLALLLNENDVIRHYKTSNGNSEKENLYILNVNYAGNEAHESYLRIRLKYNENNLDKMASETLADKYLRAEPSVIGWLLYLGFLVWVPRNTK